MRKSIRYGDAEKDVADEFLVTKRMKKQDIGASKEEVEELIVSLAAVRKDGQKRTFNAIQCLLTNRRIALGFIEGHRVPRKKVEKKAVVKELSVVENHGNAEMSGFLAGITAQVKAAVEKQREADQKKIKCLEGKLIVRDKEIVTLKKQRRILKEVLLLTCRIRQEAATLNKMVESIKRDEGIDVYALVQEKED
ncbi:hypothetical protein KJ866_04440 [Patescibacteria group bacterium]|nr:hypothetical protein [Patescibacteria group bacterium]MBU2219807.1 hypothetical protein [Patescibacteria group bacterium]